MTVSNATWTVLGSAGSHTGPGRVCAGHLLRTPGATVLVDAGNGSTANLQRCVALTELDAVIISHRHVDHCIDLVGMFYARRFNPQMDTPLPLYAPAGVADMLTSVLSADSALAFGDVFSIHEIAPGDECTIGDVSVTFFAATHPVAAVSMRCATPDGVVAYSGDTAANEALIACARDAAVFVCEATWQGDAADYPDGLHLVAADAGKIATAAEAKRLVLTHIAGGLDVAVSVAQAQSTFAGPVEAADDLSRYELT